MPLIIASLDELGVQLKNIQKKAKGMSQEQLAKQSGYSPQHISALFKGNAKFTQESIERLAQAMNIKVHIVIAMDENDVKRLLDAQY